MNNNPIYLPGLNGLRAIAAVAVVISHTTIALNEFGLDNTILSSSNNGSVQGLKLAGFGVSIFFALSGFLITYLLLNEKEVGKFKIKEFYIRRILRIWPLYYLYLFLAIVIAIFFNLNIEKSSVPFYIFLAANIPYILGKTLPFLAHFWSLGVEEQFYLFFPQIGKLKSNQIFSISISIILIWILLKTSLWVLNKTYNLGILLDFFYINRFHIMLFGVVAAILYYKNHQKFIRITTSTIGQILAWLLLLLITINKFGLSTTLIDEEIVGILAIFLIMGQVTKTNKFIDLENMFFDFIGKISFGMYVIHPLIIFILSKLTGNLQESLMSYVFVYMAILSLTVMVAYLSYQYYEKPFLKYKSKFTTVHSVNSK